MAGSLFRVRKSDDPADFANTGFADAGLDQRRFHFEFMEGFDAGTIDGEVRRVRAVADGALAAGFAGNVDEFCEEMRFADIAAVDARAGKFWKRERSCRHKNGFQSKVLRILQGVSRFIRRNLRSDDVKEVHAKSELLCAKGEESTV